MYFVQDGRYDREVKGHGKGHKGHGQKDKGHDDGDDHRGKGRDLARPRRPDVEKLYISTCVSPGGEPHKPDSESEVLDL